jgi:hypothetical protein
MTQALLRILLKSQCTDLHAPTLSAVLCVSCCCLQRRFSQGPGAPTASSKSPAATPVLAIYSAKGEPIWCDS